MRFCSRKRVPILLAFVLLAYALPSVTLGTCEYAAERNHARPDLDIVETSLRVILKEPASPIPRLMRLTLFSNTEALSAALRLLNFEQRHPGYLEALKLGTAEGEQEEAVKRLYGVLSEKYEFWNLSTPGDLPDLDGPESALRIILGKPARAMPFWLRLLMFSKKSKIDVALGLLNYEQRHPGVIRSLAKNSRGEQGQLVFELFTELARKYEFFWN